MASLFEFRWAVDQDGYEIVRVPAHSGPSVLDNWDEYDVIRPRGGPTREYRPLDDYPGLWRRITACYSANDALAFIQQFGLLAPWPGGRQEERVDTVLGTAELIRQIADKIDGKHYAEAVALWNKYEVRPRLTAGLIPTKRAGRFEFKPIPQNLHGALMLQTGDAIAGNQQWRHCRNDGCPEWFRIGTGAKTSRREFCSDRCRVAWARRQKPRQEA
jgi:hypothetical protein